MIDWTNRFWSKVARPTWTDCWIWTGAKNGSGYGAHSVGSKSDGTYLQVRAHRHAYESVNGSVQRSLVVRHKCDVKLCCNPSHLELGTIADNSRDMVERGRSLCGERNPKAKLTKDQVAEIRARFSAGGHTKKSLADEYGVDRPAVSRIVRGVRWTRTEPTQ